LGWAGGRLTPKVDRLYTSRASSPLGFPSTLPKFDRRRAATRHHGLAAIREGPSLCAHAPDLTINEIIAKVADQEKEFHCQGDADPEKGKRKLKPKSKERSCNNREERFQTVRALKESMNVSGNLPLRRKGKRDRDAGDGEERELSEELRSMTRKELAARCAELNLCGNVQEKKSVLQQRIARFMNLPSPDKSVQPAASDVSTGPIAKRARRVAKPKCDEDGIDDDEEEDGSDDDDEENDDSDGDEEEEEEEDDEDSIVLLQKKMHDALQQFNEYMEHEEEEYEIDSEFKTTNFGTSSKAPATEFDLVKQDVLCNRFILYRWDAGWEACKVTANFREGKFNYVMKDNAGEKPCNETKVQLLLSKCLPSNVSKAAPSSWIPLRLVS